jgi:hypothetical protein
LKKFSLFGIIEKCSLFGIIGKMFLNLKKNNNTFLGSKNMTHMLMEEVFQYMKKDLFSYKIHFLYPIPAFTLIKVYIHRR